MSQRSTGFVDGARGLLAAALLATAGAASAATPVVQPPFDAHYTLVNLGPIDGVHVPYGGLNFVPGDPDTIVIGGFAGAGTAELDAVALTRDSTGSISGFAGTVQYAPAYAVAGGVAWGPGGVLFYTRWTYSVGEIKPNGTTTDKVIDLSGLYYRPGGLDFVPAGLPGAGKLKMTTWAYGYWYSFDAVPDGTGTYDMSNGTSNPSMFPGNPMAFAYRAPGTAGFVGPGVVVCEYANAYGAGNVVWYDVDQTGDPILNTRTVIVSGLDVPDGIAIDPLTGDLLFASYQGYLYVLRTAPVPPTTTSTSTTTSTTSTTKTTTTTTSTTTTTTSTTHTTTTSTTTTTTSTTAPTTSTTKTTTSTTSTTTSTTHPTTTSTTVPTTTTSTAAPTTTTTSTTTRPSTTSTSTTSTSSTTRPSTTSTSSTTATSSTTTTTSPTTTTTLPSPCGGGPSFQSIGCEVDALLALVRGSTQLGALQPAFVTRLERAQATVADGAAACADGRRALARDALDRIERQMLIVRARTRTLRARKTIPRSLAEQIAGAARAIATHADALAGSLTCP